MIRLFLVTTAVVVGQSCTRPLFRKIDIIDNKLPAFSFAENTQLQSISVLNRACIECKGKPVPISFDTNMKTLTVICNFMNDYYKKSSLPLIRCLNDSLFYLSEISNTKRVSRFLNNDRIKDGIFLIVTNSFIGFPAAGIGGGASGDIETTYEFIELLNGQKKGYTALKLTRAAGFNKRQPNRKDIKAIFKRLKKHRE